MSNSEPFSWKAAAIPYVATTVGSLLSAISINAFFLPHHLLSSGISGVAIMLYYALGFPIGISNLLINVPIMIGCYKYMGRSYTLLSMIGTFFYSAMIDAMSFTSQTQLIQEPIIAAIAGGILNGIAMGIIYKYNGNTGGLDVLGAIIKKFYSLEMGNAVMALNTVILLFAAYMFSLELAVLTFSATFISTYITNKVVVGLQQRKSVLIISNQSETIAKILMRYIGHGATYLAGKGAYTMQEKEIIYAVIKLTEVSKVKELVNKIDPQAFIIISDASEVVGKGFTAPPVKYHESPGESLSLPRTKKSMPPEY